MYNTSREYQVTVFYSAGNTLNILLVGGADLRHVMQTLAKTHQKQNLNLHVCTCIMIYIYYIIFITSKWVLPIATIQGTMLSIPFTVKC